MPRTLPSLSPSQGPTLRVLGSRPQAPLGRVSVSAPRAAKEHGGDTRGTCSQHDLSPLTLTLNPWLRPRL